MSKGGAEGLRGVGLLPGARGAGRPAAGVAVRIEDGDGFGARANRAVTVEALGQLGVARRSGASGCWRSSIDRSPGRRLATTSRQVVPGFELAPISELG